MKKEKNVEIFDVDAQLDAAFGKEGTQERMAAEERANAFFTGQIIEEARRNANITQEELAARIGTNKSYISRVETGRTEPKVSTFYRIIAALGLTVELTPASRILVFFLLMLPTASVAQNSAGTLKAPAAPTPIEVRERTIQDLLYFPFTCISTPMPTREAAWKEVEDTFGSCETINGSPGLHAGVVFNFTYRGVPIGLCYYSFYGDRTWYDFFFKSKSEADQFYNDMVSDIKSAGIPLTYDKIYGGLSNRKKPVSIFKWVYSFPPVKVKKPGPSNIEPAETVGMYKVELGVYKRKLSH